MFGTIRKHQTWLWGIIIAVMSVSMVVFFSNTGGLGGRASAPTGNYGSMNGEPFALPEFQDAWKEVRVAYVIRTGKPPGGDEATSRRIEDDAVSRLFLIHKLKTMDIEPSEKAIGAMMEEQIRDYPLAKFEEDYLKPNGLDLSDYRRFLAHEAGIRQLFSAVSVAARLVSPQEAESLYRKEHQEVLVQLAGFWATNFLDKVVITNGAIATYYTNRMGFYRTPERTVINYIAFEPSNFLAEAEVEIKKITNINDVVTKAYFERGTNEWKGTNGSILSESEAKKKILDDVYLRFELTAARRAAAEFGTKLMNQPDPNKAENFEKAAAENKLQVRTSKPFDRVSGLEEFKTAEDMESERETEPFVETLRQRALALTPDRPILFNSIPGPHAVYLIALKEKVPSELPPLEKIQEKVTADYRHQIALDLARQAGRAFEVAVTNGLVAKKSFDELCAAANVKAVDLPPFSSSTRSLTNLDSRISFQQLSSLAAELPVGQATGFVSQPPEGGYVAYVKARPPLDEQKVKAELPEFTATIRQYRQNEAFQQWFRRQAELARLSGLKRGPSVGAAN
jgi:hypothetical protein